MESKPIKVRYVEEGREFEAWQSISIETWDFYLYSEQATVYSTATAG